MTNEVLNLLEKAEGVLHGHFCLTSGLHSDIYFQCAKLYQYPEITSELGKRLAEQLADLEFDTIVAPAIGAVIIGYETAKNAKKRNLFVERKDGEMQLRRGYTLKKGEKVVIIEDVTTSGKSIEETYPKIKAQETTPGAIKIVGEIVSLNRQERALDTTKSALDTITEKYGFPAKAIVSMEEVVDALYTNGDKTIITDEIKQAIDKYYEEFGAK